jgi:glycosyltransferase involved in cell wall biosynthesis
LSEHGKPLVSIVTPSFNQAEFLEETICSVLDQAYEHLEYLIVDGGSTDGSLDILEKYSHRLAWWVSEPDKGQTDAINKGFAKANGDILAWLNSDDTYLQGSISEAVGYLEAYPDVGAVYGDCNLINKEGEILGKFPARQTDYRRLMRGYVHIPQQATFFRGDLWRIVGPLDPSFYFAMDFDLWVRLSKQAPLKYYPRLWANFRLHGDAKTVESDDRCWPEMVEVHRREGGRRFSWLTVKAKLRPWLYGWMPMDMRLKIRKYL